MAGLLLNDYGAPTRLVGKCAIRHIDSRPIYAEQAMSADGIKRHRSSCPGSTYQQRKRSQRSKSSAPLRYIHPRPDPGTVGPVDGRAYCEAKRRSLQRLSRISRSMRPKDPAERAICKSSRKMLLPVLQKSASTSIAVAKTSASAGIPRRANRSV